jgi:hypothetical protein
LAQVIGKPKFEGWVGLFHNLEKTGEIEISVEFVAKEIVIQQHKPMTEIVFH